MVDAADLGFAFGDERCEYERCTGAEVRTHHFGAFERKPALDGRCVPAERDVCAQAFHFGYVLETVVVDGVLDDAVARYGKQGGHEGRLHVGGVAREGERLDGDGLEFLPAGVDFCPVGTYGHLAVHVAECVERGGYVFGNDLVDPHAATRNGCTAKECAGLDAVGNGEAITRA